MHIGHKFKTSYKMPDNGVDKVLEDLSEDKDLGVFVMSDLKGTLRRRLSHGYFSFIAKYTSNLSLIHI